MNAIAKTLIISLIGLGAYQAHAATDWEGSVGSSLGTPQDNGTWYQKGFPYKLGMKSSAFSLGLRTDLATHAALHVSAYWLGTNTSDAWAVTHDDLYSAHTEDHCVTVCPRLAHFIGRGTSGGVRALLELHTGGAWDVGFLIGPVLTRTTWRMDVPDWFPTAPTANGYTAGTGYPVHLNATRWRLTTMTGFRVTHGRQFMELMFYRDGSPLQPGGEYYPPIWKKHTVLSYGFAL